MPPEIKRIPLPTGRGRDAHDFLEAHGITATVPNIRSSDASAACEFQYYLGRRLSLTPLHSYNAAFSVGGWAHRYLQLWYSSARDAEYDHAVNAAVERVASISRVTLPPPGWVDAQRKHIRDDAEYARAIIRAGFSLPLSSPARTIQSLVLDRYRPIAHELSITVPAFPPPTTSRTNLVVQLDLLLFDPDRHRLHVVDLKTTSAPPLARAELCAVEFQTWMYLDVTRRALPDIISRFSLPPDTQLSSMIHLIVQKPPIRMSLKDRDFILREREITRGPNKGEIRIERVAVSDDPKPENFRNRVVDYMLGRGEYADQSTARHDNPMANIHYTPLESIPDTDWDEYRSTIEYLHGLATRDPYPKNFRRNAHCMLDHAQLTPYAPLYRLPVQAWPAYIRSQNLIQTSREPWEPLVGGSSIERSNV